MRKSKYDKKLREEKLDKLDDLTRLYKNVEDEITPLQAYKNTIVGQMKEIMSELDLTEYGKITYNKEWDKFIDFHKLARDFPEVHKYVVGTVDERKTLSYMYEDHLDVRVSKTLLEKAIDKTKVGDVMREKIRVKN